MKTLLYGIIAAACLASALVGLGISYLLGQPISLFKEDER